MRYLPRREHSYETFCNQYNPQPPPCRLPYGCGFPGYVWGWFQVLTSITQARPLTFCFAINFLFLGFDKFFRLSVRSCFLREDIAIPVFAMRQSLTYWYRLPPCSALAFSQAKECLLIYPQNYPSGSFNAASLPCHSSLALVLGPKKRKVGIDPLLPKVKPSPLNPTRLYKNPPPNGGVSVGY